MTDVLEQEVILKELEEMKKEIIGVFRDEVNELTRDGNKKILQEKKERVHEGRELRKNLADSVKAIEKSHRKLKNEMLNYRSSEELFGKSLSKALDDNYKTTLQVARKTAESIQLLNNKIESFTEILEDKNKEISAYRDGYELNLNKKAYMQIIRLISDTENNSESMNEESKLDFCMKQLRNILMDMGVEEFIPQSGDEADRRFMTIASQTETDDSELDNTVSKVIKSGYFVNISENGRRVLETCIVETYKYNGKEES